MSIQKVPQSIPFLFLGIGLQAKAETQSQSVINEQDLPYLEVLTVQKTMYCFVFCPRETARTTVKLTIKQKHCN